MVFSDYDRGSFGAVCLRLHGDSLAIASASGRFAPGSWSLAFVQRIVTNYKLVVQRVVELFDIQPSLSAHRLHRGFHATLPYYMGLD